MKIGPTVAIVAAGLATACGGGSSPVSDPGSGTTSLATVQTKVLTPRCALPGCHAGSGAPFDLDMSSIAASSAHLIGVPSGEKPVVLRVAAGDASQSYLYWKVSGNPAIGGDPMPASGGPLSGADLDLIAAWINGGAR